MKFYIGITDSHWYDFLSRRKPSEVNFWRPMSKIPFKVLSPGAPFLFKLHKPEHCIVGGGIFTHYARLPLSKAWDIFEQNNGAPNFSTFFANIEYYRARRGLKTQDPEIGCIVISSPVFFNERDWIEAPSDWSDNLVQGKSYVTNEPNGLEIWNKVEPLFLGSGVRI